MVHLGAERLGRRVTAAGVLHGPPGGQETQLAVAGGLWVRCHNLHAGPDEVAPVPDAFRVAVPYHEHDRRVIWQGTVRQTVLPVGDDQFILAERVRVGPES